MKVCLYFDIRWFLYRLHKHTCPRCSEFLIANKFEKSFKCPACNLIISEIEQRENERNLPFDDSPLSLDAVAEITNNRATHTSFGPEYRGCCEIKSHYKTSCIIKAEDNSQINFEETKVCTVSFITPNVYPASIWVGKDMELYEGDRLVGHMKIVTINNPELDRNKVFADRTDVLTDYDLLNHVLKLSLEWGKEYGCPLNNKIMKAFPSLSGGDIERVANYIDKVRDDVLWRIYYDHYDYKKETFTIDVETVTKNKYPWISKSNLLSLHSQGRYYSWHG